MNTVHDTGCLVRSRKPAQACARQEARIEINGHLAIKEAFLGVHGSSPIPIVRKPEKEEYHNRLPDAQGIYIYARRSGLSELRNATTPGLFRGRESYSIFPDHCSPSFGTLPHFGAMSSLNSTTMARKFARHNAAGRSAGT